MISIRCPHNPRALGDVIDSIYLGHMISYIDEKIINVQINHAEQRFLNDFVGFGHVIIGKERDGDEILEFDNRTSQGRKLYYEYASKFKSVPKTSMEFNLNIELPEKYVTAQWDAQQIYRDIRKYDKDKANKIEQKYIDEGFEVIRVGGEGKYKELHHIAYIMKKASYHIGAESGMMHIAKFIMNCDQLHIYRNIQRREEFDRFPDGWDMAWMGREMLRVGMRLNPMYEYDKKQEEYFKDTNLFYK